MIADFREQDSHWLDMIRKSGREPTDAEVGMAETICHHEQRLAGVVRLIPNDPVFVGVDLTDDYKVKAFDAARKALYD